MGSCSSSRGASGRYAGGSLNPSDILSETDMIVERGNRSEVDEVLTVSRDLMDMYGQNVPLQQFFIAELAGGEAQGVLGYYDGSNIAINDRYLDSAAMTKAYADSVKSGFHPSNGNKTAIQAVAAHEFGHAATDAVAAKLGLTLEGAADRIVNEARQGSGHRGVVQMASKISKYATSSNAEAVAEAFCDVYCNGNKATKESHAIVSAMNKYLK